MELLLEVPQELIVKAATEIKKFDCLRKTPRFKLISGQWQTDLVCHGYGDGYGVATCKEDCCLRITDLSKCIPVSTDFGNYMVQFGSKRLDILFLGDIQPDRHWRVVIEDTLLGKRVALTQEEDDRWKMIARFNRPKEDALRYLVMFSRIYQIPMHYGFQVTC